MKEDITFDKCNRKVVSYFIENGKTDIVSDVNPSLWALEQSFVFSPDFSNPNLRQ